MSKPKLALIPSGYKSGKVYSILPNDATGDFDFDRASEGTRVRKDGLIEEVADDVPRLNWYNSNCPSLLLEPQRTNIQLRSEEFDNAVWSKVNASITANQIVAPNGEYTADKLTATATSLSTYVYEQHSLSTSTDYSMSVFVKKGTSNLVRLDLEDFTSGTQGRMTFNLNTKEITQTVGTASYEDYGNGWYRLKVSFTTSATLGIHYLRIWDYETVNGAYFYLWGAQIEEGSYCSSYIKTEGSTVTRLQDHCYGSGTADLFDTEVGVIYLELKKNGLESTFSGLSLSDGTTSNRIQIRYVADSNTIQVVVRVGGSAVVVISHTLTDVTVRHKIALKFEADDYAFWVNGTEVGTDTSGALPPNLSEFAFDDGNGANLFFGSVYEARVYTNDLTDTELTELTTL